ncbi:hypothetical protein OQZ33_07065 [Pedobacter sp. MC2016-05]|uniref:hypothetical protein n=1 Tax=Pedobacter sp. MC2016-05 TaxID=2994474 RepID=UPI002246A9F5|nr:hypothetical protein [Pedobacter sp. MC2016-05]MCX2474085.1 hypothetical protein [Pedobacter sp. MC2016-05]
MINIVNAPFPYQPVGNTNVFQITSSDERIVYFLVEVINAVSNQIIASLKFHVRPDTPNGVSFNLSDILSSQVETKINNSNEAIALAIDDASITYRLAITEYINVDGKIIQGDFYSHTNDKYTVWDASFDRLLFTAYIQDKHVTNSNFKAKFLSLKEQISNQTGTSSEHLYFINQNNLAVKTRIRVYDTNGTQINLFEANLPSGVVIRLNVSPKTIYHLFNADFSNVGHYRVDLIDINGHVVSEEKVYKYTSDACNLQPINLLFTNSLGGVESFTFFNPIESIQVTKTSLKTNVIQLVNGVYSDNQNGLVNPTERIISSSAVSTFKVFSDVLSDNETIMLKELITSKSVWVELNDNKTLIPITITNSSYNVNLRRTNGYKLNRPEVSFTTQTGFIPSSSDLFGEGNNNVMIQFQDMPLAPTYNNGVIYHSGDNGVISI